MGLEFGWLGFREIRGQDLENFGARFWGNSIEELMMNRSADRDGAVGDFIIPQQCVNSPCQIADELPFLFGFRVEIFSRRKIAGGMGRATPPGKAPRLISDLFGEFLVSAFRL